MSTLSACCTCIYSIRLCHIAFELETWRLSLFATLHEAGEILPGEGRIPQSFPAIAIAKETGLLAPRRAASTVGSIHGGHHPRWAASVVSSICGGHHPRWAASMVSSIRGGQHPWWAASMVSSIRGEQHLWWAASVVSSIRGGQHPQWAASVVSSIHLGRRSPQTGDTAEGHEEPELSVAGDGVFSPSLPFKIFSLST